MLTCAASGLSGPIARRRKPGDRSYLGAFSAADIAEGLLNARPDQPMEARSSAADDDRGKGKATETWERDEDNYGAFPQGGVRHEEAAAWQGLPAEQDDQQGWHDNLEEAPGLYGGELAEWCAYGSHRKLALLLLSRCVGMSSQPKLAF